MNRATLSFCFRARRTRRRTFRWRRPELMGVSARSRAWSATAAEGLPAAACTLETGPWWNIPALPSMRDNRPEAMGRRRNWLLAVVVVIRALMELLGRLLLPLMTTERVAGNTWPGEPTISDPIPAPIPESSWRKKPLVERRPRIRLGSDAGRPVLHWRPRTEAYWKSRQRRNSNWALLRGAVGAGDGQWARGRRPFPIWSDFHLRPPERRSSIPLIRLDTGWFELVAVVPVMAW